MNNKSLQLKYGLGIIHSVPWLEVASGEHKLHLVEPAIITHLAPKVKTTIAEAYTLPMQSGTFVLTIPPGTKVSITERTSRAKNLAQKIVVQLGEGSELTYTIHTHGGTSAIIRSINCEKGSRLSVLESAVETEDLISHTEIVLAGEGAAVEYSSAFYGTGESVIDTSQRVHHQASNTSSMLATRGVLGGKAKGFYRATIDIAHGATGCSGHQDEKTILLSDSARMMAVPALEIANQDVSASHAVATTRIKPEDLFYVQSRGISEADARAAMIRAHLAPVLGACAEEVLGEIDLT